MEYLLRQRAPSLKAAAAAAAATKAAERGQSGEEANGEFLSEESHVDDLSRATVPTPLLALRALEGIVTG